MGRQGELLAILSKKARELRASKDLRPVKIQKLQSFISEAKHGLLTMAPLPLPLDARIEITGINPDKCSVFKSNLFPLRIQFKCSDGSEYPIIYKNGDDMRQDQLVIQLFTLMDRLLRKENLDLRISPYEVLATGPLEGMVEFIASKTIAAIISDHSSILNYFRANAPDEGSVGTYGIDPKVLDTFVRSCGMITRVTAKLILTSVILAGYSVLTYVMGVGDRHLDNLLCAPNGEFMENFINRFLMCFTRSFLPWWVYIQLLILSNSIIRAVDYGYILGRDPKPFPPPVKVSKEMVDGMGGANSTHYNRFKNYCFTAFTILRKNANLILNLVSLMVDANIPDIKHRDVHQQIQEKFRLDLMEEDALKHFEAILNETSYITVVFDRFHNIAQGWRA
jgi:phosphatidylinositol 3-kinase